MTLNIAIAGAAGRMGRMLIDTVTHRGEDMRLSGALEHDASPLLGQVKVARQNGSCW